MVELDVSIRRMSLGPRWHTTTFRWLSAYALIFTISVMLLVGFIAWATTNTMTRDTDEVLDWQLIYFDSIPDNQLTMAIHRRLEHEHMHTNFYGLFAADGKHVAGDILIAPSAIKSDRVGRTLEQPLKLLDSQEEPVVVRAMGETRSDGRQLVVARDLTHVVHIRDTIIKALVGGGMSCLAAGVVGGVVLSVRQIRRVRGIRRVTEQISLGDLQQRLPVGGRDELDMLAHLVNRMLDEVERLMSEVKGACDGIAHDLRTPLVHVRSLLGRIAGRSSIVEDASGFEMLDRARLETDVLLERFAAMLRISEIGALQRRGGFGTVQLQALIEDIGALYEPLAECKAIQWGVRTVPVGEIYGDRALLFEAFSNLIDNAIKFAPSGGTVRIVLSSTRNGPLLEIADNGPGVPVDERDSVLQPFYRSEQVRHVAGSGLGLSIVSAVMRVHDFTLGISDAQPGARFTIECWSHSLA